MFGSQDHENVADLNATDRLLTEIELLARSFERHLKSEARGFARQVGSVTLDDVYYMAPFIMAGLVEAHSGYRFQIIEPEDSDLCNDCRDELYDDIDRGLRDLLGGSGAEGA